MIKRIASTIMTYIDYKQKEGRGISCKCCQKKARRAIVILDKVDFKSKKMTRNKKGHYVMSKGESTKKTQQS